MTESRQRCEALVVKAVDGLLAEEEEQELEALLEEYPEYRDELEDFVGIKEATDALRDRILDDGQVESVRSDVTSRFLAGLGFWLLLASSLFLMGFAAWAFALDSAVPLAQKVGVGVGGAGLFALFLHVLRIRRRALGHDPYREIDQ